MRLTAVDPAAVTRILAVVSILPGVDAAGVTSSLPPSVSQMHTTIAPIGSTVGPSEDVPVEIVSVSPATFTALGVRLIAGRVFRPGDLQDEQPRIVMSDTAARRILPGVDPVGRTLPFGPPNPDRKDPIIVGVVGDVRYAGLDAPTGGALYFPYTERPFASTYLVVRGRGEHDALARLVTGAIWRTKPGQAVSRVRPLSSVIQAASAAARVRTALVDGIALLALGLAAIGLYGLTAQTVASRRREFGVRMALGADVRAIWWLVIGDGARLALAGLVIGALPAWLATRFLGSRLYGVGPGDPAPLAAAWVLLTLLVVLSAWLPASRAARLDPAAVLRDADPAF